MVAFDNALPLQLLTALQVACCEMSDGPVFDTRVCQRSRQRLSLMPPFGQSILVETASMQAVASDPMAELPRHGYPTGSFFSYNQSMEDANLITRAAKCLEGFAVENFGDVLANDRITSVEAW